MVKRGELSGCNAARFDRCEDMAEMAELNEASVLHNLISRYQSDLIYVRLHWSSWPELVLLMRMHPRVLVDLFGAVPGGHQSLSSIPHL